MGLISSEKLKAHYGWLDKDSQLTPKDFDDIVDVQPVVDAVEVVHGHWIYEKELDVDRNRQARCSVCGAGDLQSPSVTVPYCWKCGARMDGERE